MMSFEPVVLSFNCNWCSYAAADLAGIARLQYPPNLRIIRVMCSGMVHPNLVVEAFQKGADGVMVMGCRPGECHYVDGDEKARRRMGVVEEMLDALGLEAERFRMVWCSSSEAERFAASVREMTETVGALGPSPYRIQLPLDHDAEEAPACPSP